MYPTCVLGCTTFPSHEGFKPQSRPALLPGQEIQYVCDKPDLVPHTDHNLTMVCQSSGELIPDPTKTVPICVRPDTCRVNDFPVHPNYVPDDASVVYYNFGEVIEMRCKDEDLVAEDRNGTRGGKQTFGIECGGTEATPSFQKPASDDDWPRCVPRVCSAEFDKLDTIVDECQCEFTRCTEFLYDEYVTHQCPEEPTGPFCGLRSYEDDFDEIASLFDGSSPSDVPTEAEMEELDAMLADLEDTTEAVDDLLTPPASRRRKRASSVPVNCKGLKVEVDKITELLNQFNTEFVYPISRIRRHCNYVNISISRGEVMYQSCEDEGLVAGLTTSNTALKGAITTFKASKATIESEYNTAKAAGDTAHQDALAVIKADSDAKLKEAEEANFRPFTPTDKDIEELISVGLPPDVPDLDEIDQLSKVVIATDNATAVIATTVTDPNADTSSTSSRKKRHVAYSCTLMKKAAEDMVHQLKFCQLGAYCLVDTLTTINEYISKSWVNYGNCEFEEQVYGLKALLDTANEEKEKVRTMAGTLKNLAKNIIGAAEVEVANTRGTFMKKVADDNGIDRADPKVWGPGDYSQASNLEVYQAQLLAAYDQDDEIPNDVIDDEEVAKANEGADAVEEGNQAAEAIVAESRRRRKREATGAATCKDFIPQMAKLRGIVELWQASKSFHSSTVATAKSSVDDIKANTVTKIMCVEENELGNLEDMISVVKAKLAGVKRDVEQLQRCSRGEFDSTSASICNLRSNFLKSAAKQVGIDRPETPSFKAGDTIAAVELRRALLDPPSNEELTKMADEAKTIDDADTVQETADKIDEAKEKAKELAEEIANSESNTQRKRRSVSDGSCRAFNTNSKELAKELSLFKRDHFFDYDRINELSDDISGSSVGGQDCIDEGEAEDAKVAAAMVEDTVKEAKADCDVLMKMAKGEWTKEATELANVREQKKKKANAKLGRAEYMAKTYEVGRGMKEDKSRVKDEKKPAQENNRQKTTDEMKSDKDAPADKDQRDTKENVDAKNNAVRGEQDSEEEVDAQKNTGSAEDEVKPYPKREEGETQKDGKTTEVKEPHPKNDGGEIQQDSNHSAEEQEKPYPNRGEGEAQYPSRDGEQKTSNTDGVAATKDDETSAETSDGENERKAPENKDVKIMPDAEEGVKGVEYPNKEDEQKPPPRKDVEGSTDGTTGEKMPPPINEKELTYPTKEDALRPEEDSGEAMSDDTRSVSKDSKDLPSENGDDEINDDETDQKPPPEKDEDMLDDEVDGNKSPLPKEDVEKMPSEKDADKKPPTDGDVQEYPKKDGEERLEENETENRPPPEKDGETSAKDGADLLPKDADKMPPTQSDGEKEKDEMVPEEEKLPPKEGEDGKEVPSPPERDTAPPEQKESVLEEEKLPPKEGEDGKEMPPPPERDAADVPAPEQKDSAPEEEDLPPKEDNKDVPPPEKSLVRRKRSAVLGKIRSKRSIKFQCRTDMVYGIQIKNLYDEANPKVDRCCCPEFEGERFRLFATIDLPWSNSLGDMRSSFYKDKFKMVDQEVRYMLGNTDYSWIAAEGIMTKVETEKEFFKTDGNKIGVHIKVTLSKPHWDNDYRIEESFKAAANEYKKRNETDVLGRIVQGRFDKNDYVTDKGRLAVRATRIALEDEDMSGSGDGSGEGSGDGEEDEEDNEVLTIIMIAVGCIILIGLPLFICFRSKACLVGTCCSKGKEEL